MCKMGETGLVGRTDILNLDVTEEGSAGCADIYYQARILSLVDMLPVTLSMSILSSNVIKTQV